MARCPDAEELSVFLDEPGDSTLAAHISACAHCQARLSDYAQVDALLQELSQPPAGLALRIQQACAAGASTTDATSVQTIQFNWLTPLRYAAALIFLLTLASFLTWLNHTPNSQGSDSSLARAPGTSQAAAPASVATVQNNQVGEDIALAEQMRPQGNIDPDSLQNVSTGKNAAGTKPANQRRYRIKPQIEHIWLVEDLTKSQTRLQELSLRDGLKLKWQTSDNIAVVHADLSGTDRQLQNLVDHLQAQGWLLLSPAYPQPKAEQNAFFTDSKIIYHATLVQKEP